MGSVLLIFLVFCVVLLCVLTFWVPCCDVRYHFHIQRCSVRLYLQLFVLGRMSYVRYLCLFMHSGVQLILCCVFVLFFFVLCTICCQFLWIVLILLPLSVFSNVYIALDINPSTIRIKYHNIYRSVEMSIVITRKSQQKLMVIYSLSVQRYLYISVLS